MCFLIVRTIRCFRGRRSFQLGVIYSDADVRIGTVSYAAGVHISDADHRRADSHRIRNCEQ
ncbi:hypothetical protein K438DRAFT_449954 [Mycena galopus ATCC 62051]|nr:hypothetical protein K438DRAFT_449954 [Mycena galopus ATCC 62051]